MVGVAQLVRPACRQAERRSVVNMGYFVYIVYSPKFQKFYTGITNNIDRRLKEHNQHLSNTPTTQKISGFNLVFCQLTKNRLEARKLEKYLKSSTGREIRRL
jgi:putative endonuclease